MAVLAFIAVLIILFLVLIVMVHMRNRKLKVYWKNRWQKDNFWIRCLQIPRLSIIHKHTKQNPGDCDLEIERAVLRFEHMESVTFENRSPIENGNPVGEQIVLEGADAVKEMLFGLV